MSTKQKKIKIDLIFFTKNQKIGLIFLDMDKINSFKLRGKI